MTKEQKLQLIEILTSGLSPTPETSTKNIYIVDISNMNANHTFQLRRSCYISKVKVILVKNTILSIVIEKNIKKLSPFFSIIKGNSFLMISSGDNVPAKIIADYKKKNNSKIPLLKAAYASEYFYIGNDKLDILVNLKSKDELIVGIISALRFSLITVVGTLLAPVYKIIEYLQKYINFNM